MNALGAALAQLHESETELARAFRRAARRQAADHGTHYPCRTLAQQCDQRARRVRALAQRHGRNIPEPHSARLLGAAAGNVRQKFSELAARRPSSGLLLLGDLRHLHLKAQAADVNWLMLGQAAQAVRDQALLDDATELHAEVAVQIKWIRTRLKEVAPQVLAFGS